jgi:hypothetical protein
MARPRDAMKDLEVRCRTKQEMKQARINRRYTKEEKRRKEFK